MKRFFKLCCLIFASLIISSCVSNKAIVTPTGNVPANLTPDQIAEAVQDAAASYDWTVTKLNDNEFWAEHKHLGKDLSAQVKILFEGQNYKIDYVSSSGLNYNKEKNTVHSRYITWVRNLNKAISDQLRAQAKGNKL